MISRRKFVANVAATTAAVTIVPRHVLGKGFTAPSDATNTKLFNNDGTGNFTQATNTGLVDEVRGGEAKFADYDNDGF